MQARHAKPNGAGVVPDTGPIDKRPAQDGLTRERAAILDLVGMGTSALGEEIDSYHSHLSEWREREGQFVLIHGQELCGFFQTSHEALEEGFRRFGHVPFLARKVQFDERPVTLGWTIR